MKTPIHTLDVWRTSARLKVEGLPHPAVASVSVAAAPDQHGSIEDVYAMELRVTCRFSAQPRTYAMAKERASRQLHAALYADFIKELHLLHSLVESSRSEAHGKIDEILRAITSSI